MNENDYTILPCPCCGAKAEFQQLGDEDGCEYLECTNQLCRMSTPLVYAAMEATKPHLVETWNRRAQRVEEAPEPLAQCQTAALDRDAELQDLRERCEYLQKERDLYHDALIARHGGEPVMLLHELDGMRERCERAKEGLRYLELYVTGKGIVQPTHQEFIERNFILDEIRSKITALHTLLNAPTEPNHTNRKTDNGN